MSDKVISDKVITQLNNYVLSNCFYMRFTSITCQSTSISKVDEVLLVRSLTDT